MQTSQAAQPSSLNQGLTAGKIILIVEDEVAIASNLAYALSTEGFVAEHFTLGQQALDRLAQTSLPQPALIVLDIGLPDISGFDVCRRLRQWSETPVIFLSARADEIDRVVGLELGADDYVTKPFSPREMVARIRAILRRQALALAAALPVTTPAATTPANTRPARFELRADEARIFYYGQALSLTRYEYLLLKTLLERPNVLFSRAQLMDLVWSDALDTQERTVDGHIKSLRAKLRQIQDEVEPIQTHRGMGYSLQIGAETI